jgi:hypothetical protein
MGSWLHQVTVLALGCKVTYIYAENIHTQAAFGIASLHLVFAGSLSLQMPGLTNKIKTGSVQGTRLRLFT